MLINLLAESSFFIVVHDHFASTEQVVHHVELRIILDLLLAEALGCEHELHLPPGDLSVRQAGGESEPLDSEIHRATPTMMALNVGLFWTSTFSMYVCTSPIRFIVSPSPIQKLPSNLVVFSSVIGNS